MYEVTVEHYAAKFTIKAMQRLPKPTVQTGIVDVEPDYSILGAPTVDWSQINETTKSRQFVTSDHRARIDHLFVVTVRTI